MAERVHLNSETVITVNCGIDVGLYTTLEIILVSPVTSTKTTQTATFVTDGSDFLIKWQATVAFLDELGDWQAQAHVDGPGGEHFGPWDSFKVWPNL